MSWLVNECLLIGHLRLVFRAMGSEVLLHGLNKQIKTKNNKNKKSNQKQIWNLEICVIMTIGIIIIQRQYH